MTFWVHALVQLIAGLAIFLLINVHPLLTQIQVQGEVLFAKVTWLSVTFVWMLFTFLLTELLLKQTRQFAARIFSKSRFGFVLFHILVAPILLYIVLIALECMLFLAITGYYPIETGPIRFYQGFGLTLTHNWPLLIVLCLGEVLRQLIFAKKIKSWLNDYALRLNPPKPLEEA